VVELRWWLKRNEFHIDGNGMPLTSTYGISIITDGKALLIILDNNSVKGFVSERNTGTIGDGDEVINLRPAVVIKGQPILLGLMPQDQADEFAEAYELCIHAPPRG
jgi:hypothetical protein